MKIEVSPNKTAVIVTVNGIPSGLMEVMYFDVLVDGVSVKRFSTEDAGVLNMANLYGRNVSEAALMMANNYAKELDKCHVL